MRSKIFERIAEEVGKLNLNHPARIGIDGITAGGKTTFAKALTSFFIERDMEAKRVSLDGFHNPKAIRYQKGRSSPKGYYYDAYNYPAIIEFLLKPLGPLGNQEYSVETFDLNSDRKIFHPEKFSMSKDGVLVVDGSFSLRKELLNHWDYKVYLDVDEEIAVKRAAIRDADFFGSSEIAHQTTKERYHKAHEIHLKEAFPSLKADLVIDNDDPEHPIVLNDILGVRRGHARVINYCPYWEVAYKKESLLIKSCVDAAIKMEHIGSTSVKGLMAKPIIDILIGFENDDEKEKASNSLKDLGYIDRGTPHHPDDHIFIKVTDNKTQTHKVHLVRYRGDQWMQKVSFRKALRRDTALREEYSNMKIDLAREFESSRPDYTKRKDPFMRPKAEYHGHARGYLSRRFCTIMNNLNFYYLRHGQTDANLNGLMCGGAWNIPLNKTGIDQASEAAVILEKHKSKIKRIFSSPLERAMKTAEMVSNSIGASVEPIEELSEWDIGEWDKKSFQDVKNDFLGTAEPPNGESREFFSNRIKSFLVFLSKQNDIPLLVSHGAVWIEIQKILKIPSLIVQNGVPYKISFVNGEYAVSELSNVW